MKSNFRQKVLALIMSVVLVPLVLIGCSEGSTGPTGGGAGSGSSSISLPSDVSDSVELSQLSFDYYGADGSSDGYLTEVLFTSSGIDLEELYNDDDYEVSNIDVIYLAVWDSSSEAAIQPGEYTIEEDRESAGFISDIGLYLGYSYDPVADEESADYAADFALSSDDRIESGTVDVALSGSIYTFTFDLSLADGGAITGTYTGRVDYEFDWSEDRGSLTNFGANSILPLVEGATWTYDNGDAVRVSITDLDAQTFEIVNTSGSGRMSGYVGSDEHGDYVSYYSYSGPDFLPVAGYFAYDPLIYQESVLTDGFSWSDTGNSNGYDYVNTLTVTDTDRDVTTAGGVEFRGCIELTRTISYPDDYDWDPHLTQAVYFVKSGVGFVGQIRTWSNETTDETYLSSYSIPGE